MTSRILIALSLFVLAGCQSVKEISGLGPEARTRIGQLRYATRSRSIVGDIILRNLSGGDYDLSFSKAGVPLLEFQTRGSRMTATGLFIRTGWSGELAHAPRSLRPWAMLSEVLPYFDTNVPSAQNAGRWSAKFERKGGMLLRADVEFPGRSSMAFSFGQ
ncbi:MAG: hypothetical protein JO207_06475 [Verrucomicrobia bacterium]|jgi:hypothetical protein|nr:hypothetical protein [Verrucomicrobiota bacterium]